MTTLGQITAAIAGPSNSAFDSYHPSQVSPPFMRFGFRSSFAFSSSSCVILSKQSRGHVLSAFQQPDSFGCCSGEYGGKDLKETLNQALSELESAFKGIATVYEFQKAYDGMLKNYVYRESPLYYANRLTEYYKRPNGEGPEIYLKREDLNPLGLHKINNAIGQALLAKKLGKKRIVTVAGVGEHGEATATACAHYGLQCTIYMGVKDMKRQALKLHRMMHLGAEVMPVQSGTATLNDATSHAIRDWVKNVETTHYIVASMAGPHPYPMMVREFHSVIGKETRKQAMEKWGGKPDVLVSCVGGESNALGLFHEFVEDKEVRLIGVEAVGNLLDSGKHTGALTKKEVGVLHGGMRYLLQDGELIDLLSITGGMQYPEQSLLKDLGRAELHSITDEEALEAFNRLHRFEGIMPGLEASHALAYLEKLCPTLANGTKVVLNCSARGEKDCGTAFKYSQV